MSEDEKENLKLIAKNQEDLKVISAYSQDSIVAVKDIIFLEKNRIFVMIVNRFMWEDIEKGIYGQNKRIRCAIRFDGILKVNQELKVTKKSIISEKNYWSVIGSHEGYLKEYGVIHERKIEHFFDKKKFLGTDKLIKKKKFKSTNFEIRFHFEPGVKITKTQDEKSILIELKNSGWKFLCKDHRIEVETGLYFGKKNSFVENQNIFISGITQNEDQEIMWELIKI